jgi:UDP-N-acetylglucosamine 2-epimerase (non-hydrolysing)
MKIISVVGTRPNFMKIAPFIGAINEYNTSLTKNRLPIASIQSPAIQHILVHTGQHYDNRMSKSFFEQLNIPEAEINLGIGSGSHAEQVGKTMIEIEKVLKSEKPDWVVVVGDVNAILSCSVTAKKENIKCCHIEAGLRSGDMSMPEEINRLIADRICDLLLTPDLIASQNLRNEGVPEHKIKFVGNIMIDTLVANMHKAEILNINDIINNNLVNRYQAAGIGQHTVGYKQLPIINVLKNFVLLTLHRPTNVDRKGILEPIVRFILDKVCKERVLIWTLHPRTRKMLETFGLFKEVCNCMNLLLLEPLSYLEMLKLNMEARIVLTDSGGLQEECTILGTPCLTLRQNTERPVTLVENGGANILVGNNIEIIRKEYNKAINRSRSPVRPELWDGNSAERCLKAILEYDGIISEL